MSNIIKFIRGAEADIPVLNQGEPAFTTDTKKVFIGDGAENHQLAMITDIAGEANTASNIGAQVEIFKQKTGVDLEFRTLKAGSDKITISNEVTGSLILSNLLDSSDDYVYNGQYAGQYWLAATDYTLGVISCYMVKYNDGATITMHVYAADADGYPAGGELGSKAVDCTTISAVTPEWVDFDLTAEAVYIETGTKYVWYLSGGDETNGIKMRYKISDETANSYRVYYAPTTWSKNTGHDDTFKLYSAATSLNYIEFDIDPSKIKLTDLISPHFDSTLADDHTYSGLTDSQPVGESVVFGDLLYFDWTDGEWKKAKADAVATTPAMRIALETKGDGDTCLMLVQGYIRDDSAFQFTSAIAYLSDGTAGAILYAAPSDSGDQVQRVGIGISADIMYFNPSIDVGEI